MTALLLAPHYDDEVLFAAYTLMRERPLIAWVFPPSDQAEREQRQMESYDALLDLGIPFTAAAAAFESCCWEGARGEDGYPYALAEHLRDHEYDMVYAPVPHFDGHSEHNAVGMVVQDVLPRERRTFYLTYTRSGGRQTVGNLVEPDPEMIARKLRALSCFRTQIEHPARQPWFYDLLDMREWYA